jgi:hypothetical protein
MDVMTDKELKNRVAASRQLVLSRLSKKLQEKYA